MKKEIISILVFFLSISSYSQCFQSATASKKGVFNIEAESARTREGWTEQSTGDFTRMIYLEWTGEDSFNDPGKGILSFPIHITEPGIYSFFWRCKVGEGENPTEHNDSWLRFPDAYASFAVKLPEKDTIRPHGICTNDCPKGTGKEGWYKMYSSGSLDWTWTSRTSDNDPHEIRVQFNEAGLYHIEISGRSRAHLIDKMILFPHYITLKDALLR